MARVDARGVAAEIIQRAARIANPGSHGNDLIPYVVRLSNPPKPHERLQLAASRILRRPIAIMPAKCPTVEEWAARYARVNPPPDCQPGGPEMAG
jgi:hypothetical protein